MATVAASADDENLCDWCGEMVEDEGVYAELNCKRCGRHVYHQSCIEDHLRKNKFAPDRLSGFPCPRGHGKQRRGDALLAAISEPCIGKIDSTHRKITKNKAKKAQAAQVYVPPPKPAPGPKKKVPTPQAAPAAGAKLLAKPTPVRGGFGPSHAHQAGPAEQSKAQMLAMVALLRKEINGVVPSKEQGGGSTGAARTAVRPAAAPAAAAAKLQPGAGAAARLGKQQQQSYIPGMEPADPVPRPAAKPFNLQEQKSAFPTLGQAVASNIPINGATAGAAAGAAPREQAAAAGDSGAINALNPEHARGFVTDLARYNALLGASAYEYEDGTDRESASEEQPEPVADDSFSYAEYEASSESEAVAAEGADPGLTDDAVLQAYLQGADLGGLPAAYAPLIQRLYDRFGDPAAGWDGGAAAAVEQPVQAVYQPQPVQAVYQPAPAQAVYHQPQPMQAVYQQPQPSQPVYQQQQRAVDGVTEQMRAAEYAQIQYMQQQSLAAQWSVPPPVYIPIPYIPVPVPSESRKPTPAAQQLPQPVPLLHSYPEAAKAAQLHATRAPQAEVDVDEDVYEDLLSLCLA